jgi:hypothetical protein
LIVDFPEAVVDRLELLHKASTLSSARWSDGGARLVASSNNPVASSCPSIARELPHTHLPPSRTDEPHSHPRQPQRLPRESNWAGVRAREAMPMRTWHAFIRARHGCTA